tara:strand:- start:3566 stop:3772 length:207 start_codon:yes stop_codon:yes gene_type:complete
MTILEAISKTLDRLDLMISRLNGNVQIKDPEQCILEEIKDVSYQVYVNAIEEGYFPGPIKNRYFTNRN